MTLLNRTVSVCLVFVALSVSCTARVSWEKRTEFVKEFIASVNEGTDFYKQYVPPEAIGEIESARSLITPTFSIDRWDNGPVFGGVECYLSFSNGASGVMYFGEKNGTITRVSFDVFEATQDKRK